MHGIVMVLQTHYTLDNPRVKTQESIMPTQITKLVQ